jgi:hypothetical protein
MVPTLPVFNDEPMTSLLGVMRFPNDLKKAAAYASCCLAAKMTPDKAVTIGIARILPILNRTAQALREESNRNERAGTAAGEVVQVLWALISNYPGVASWHHATRLTEEAAVRACKEQTRRSAARRSPHRRKETPAVSSTMLRKYLREFSPVLHLWGAWCIRGRRWNWDDSVGYSLPNDVAMFLCEAETLFEQLQKWDTAKSPRSEYLAIDAFHPANDWRPPQRLDGWPMTGGICGLKIDEASVPEIANLKKSGRPRGNPV